MTVDVATTAYETRPQRVVSGPGAIRQVADEVARLGLRRAMVVTGTSGLVSVQGALPGRNVVAVVDAVRPHVPLEVAEAARHLARDSGADVLVSVGGGSAVGTAKAVALTEHLPIVAVPTTYAGSEATDVWGVTQAGQKTTGTDASVLPRTVIYDPELTVGLPPELTVRSGLNALAHCVDSLWGPLAGPVSTALADEGIRLLGLGLPVVVTDPADITARSRCQEGAYLAASAFAAAGSGMHHAVCHVLGGAFTLEHAGLHAVLLPHVVGFNTPAAPVAAERIATALDSAGLGPDGSTNALAASGHPMAEESLATLSALYSNLGAPTSLGALGLLADQVPEAARLAAAAVPPTNPRPVTEADMLALLGRAQAGERAVVVPL